MTFLMKVLRGVNRTEVGSWLEELLSINTSTILLDQLALIRYSSFHSPFILCGIRHVLENNLFQTYMDKFPNILLVYTVLSHTKDNPYKIIGKPKGLQHKRQSSWVSLQSRLLHPSCHHHQRSWTILVFALFISTNDNQPLNPSA